MKFNISFADSAPIFKVQNILLTLAKEADTYVTYLVLTQIISQEVNNVQTLIRSADFFAVHAQFLSIFPCSRSLQYLMSIIQNLLQMSKNL